MAMMSGRNWNRKTTRPGFSRHSRCAAFLQTIGEDEIVRAREKLRTVIDPPRGPAVPACGSRRLISEFRADQFCRHRRVSTKEAVS